MKRQRARASASILPLTSALYHNADPYDAKGLPECRAKKKTHHSPFNRCYASSIVTSAAVRERTGRSVKIPCVERDFGIAVVNINRRREDVPSFEDLRSGSFPCQSNPSFMRNSHRFEDGGAKMRHLDDKDPRSSHNLQPDWR